MGLRLARLLTLLAAAAMPALGILPTAAFSERGPLRVATAAPGEDPNGGEE